MTSLHPRAEYEDNRPNWRTIKRVLATTSGGEGVITAQWSNPRGETGPTAPPVFTHLGFGGFAAKYTLLPAEIRQAA